MAESGPTCFNGATAFEPWNQTAFQSSRPRSTSGFNGATAFEPWNLKLANLKPSQLWGASMGPRHLSRGIVTEVRTARASVALLQWGHGI